MAETTVTLESTLSALIEGKKYAALRDILVTMNPADVAAVFEETDELSDTVRGEGGFGSTGSK